MTNVNLLTIVKFYYCEEVYIDQCKPLKILLLSRGLHWNNILTLARSYRKIWPDMLRNGGSMYPDGRRPEGLH